MNSMLAQGKSLDFLAVILFLQFIAYATVFFDIPVARDVFGFLYLTFVPGFLIIKLLKLDELDRLETVLFSVGFSVALLMLAGLIINEIGRLFGISQPLSLIPLMIILNGLIFLGGVLVYSRSENVELYGAAPLGLFPLELLLIVLPIFSVVGAIWVRTYENNLILLTVIIAIALLFAFGFISKKVLPPKLYALAVFLITISLLYHSSFISKYLVTFGSDIQVEYFVFQTTRNGAYWSSIFAYTGEPNYGRLNSMLSITVLPSIYSILLNANAEHVLRILYPLIFSFAPLGLYQLWQKNFGRKNAFAAAFLLVAQMTFYTEILGLCRQMIAELFFVLLLLVVLNKKVKPFNKMICFIIFSVALVTSHYALGEIFLFFISFTVIFLFLMKKPSRNITVTMAVIFFVIMFSWYIYTSNSATFDSFVSYGNYVYNQSGDFFNLGSREETVLRGLGLESAPSIWNTISRAFAYLTEFLIVAGFIGLIISRKSVQLEIEYFIFTLIAAAFLVALIAVPGLADTLNMTRFYHILLFFLAPLSALGAEFLVKLVYKREKTLHASILFLVVLMPYFLFQTGFIYEVTGSESWSLPLSSYRMDGYKLYLTLGYIDDLSVFGAQWMHRKVYIQRTQVYADFSSTKVLTIYGSIYTGYVALLSNTTTVSINGTVYLNPLNTIHRTIVTKSYLCTLDELSFLDNLNKLYANGGSEIYRNSIGD